MGSFLGEITYVSARIKALHATTASMAHTIHLKPLIAAIRFTFATKHECNYVNVNETFKIK